MTLYAQNILKTVQTYQESNLALLQNLNCLIGTANTKFKNFNDDYEANLGSSISFDTPPRAVANIGLVAKWQPAVQLSETLTCDQASNASYTITNQQQIFNVDKSGNNYNKIFGESYVAELAAAVEINVALNFISAVPINDIDEDGQTVPTGALHTESGPFRFFGDGVTQLTSYNQLAKAIQVFRNFGSVKENVKVYLPDSVYPAIVGSGLNQFSPRRNDEIAMSWEIGEFGTPPVKYYSSNLLPIQYAGNVGEEGTELTLVSTNDPTGKNVTQLTFSGFSASDLDAIKSGDLGQFIDGVSGFRNMRYLTYIGHTPCDNPVQFRAMADAESNVSGNVTITITPALNWAGGQTQNLNQALQPGMKVKILPSHRAGGIVGGNSLFLAMPKLPNQDPFYTANAYDPATQVSIRLSYGSQFARNQKGFVWDETHGSHIPPIYCSRFIIPLTQSGS